MTIWRDDMIKVREHPAPFSEPIIRRLAYLVRKYDLINERVLDPFAGIGLIHNLSGLCHTTGVEIEPGWAKAHPRTIVGDATALPFPDNSFAAMITSPVYANRMSDHHNARDGSRRITYRHLYGQELHERNAGQMQWGHAYRDLHRAAWTEAARVSTSYLIVNLSNHIRKGVEQKVVEWHINELASYGYIEEVIAIPTPRMGYGQNGSVRVNSEKIVVVRL